MNEVMQVVGEGEHLWETMYDGLSGHPLMASQKFRDFSDHPNPLCHTNMLVLLRPSYIVSQKRDVIYELPLSETVKSV